MDARTGAGPLLPADQPRTDDEGQNGKLGHFSPESMAERFGADVVPFVLRGDCPGCGLRRPADGDPCPQCGNVPDCTRQAGCPLHGSVEECPADTEFTEIIERARFCAALRGLVAWFEENPGWPVPWAVTFSSRAEPERIAAIRDAANLRIGSALDHENGQMTFWPRVAGIEHCSMTLAPPEIERKAEPEVAR